MSWHIPETTMLAYVSGRIQDVDAWSVEAHLVECQACRELAAASAAEDTEAATVVERAWAAMPAELPAQGRVRRTGRLRRAFGLAASGPAARRAWLTATVIVLGLSLVLDLGGQTVGAAGARVPWLTLLAPVIPVLGVAAAYDSGLDDSREIIASTPSGGLRLLLWRTLAVLVVAVPAALLAGWWASTGSPAGWLLPALALTALTLAVGSVIGVAPAAVAVGLGWLAVVVAPTVASNSAPMVAADAVDVWLPLAILSAAAVAVRWRSFSRLPLRTRPGIEG